MSLLLRDELRIVFSPEQVAIVHLGRGRKPEVVARHVVACVPPAASEAPWAKALESLETGLRTMAGANRDAQVVLSNHFVRYALVPWRYLISDKDEEQAFIRHCFSQTYGAGAQQWAMRISPGGYGETQVACAIDQGLLDGLENVMRAHGLRLVSLQPYFMAMFNQWRLQLQGSVVWFVVAEPGRLCVALLKQGCWQILRTIRVGNDWLDALKKLLEREYLISESGAERGKVYLYAPGSSPATVLPGWALHQLDKNLDAAPHSGMHYSMSMSE